MINRASIDHALQCDDRLLTGTPATARRGSRAAWTRARILGGCGLALAMTLFGTVLWLDSGDWRRLLLFACIVVVAAGFGRGRQAPAASGRR